MQRPLLLICLGQIMKLHLLCCLLVLSVFARGQKPFFRAVEGSAFIFSDNLYLGKKDWQHAKLIPATQLTQSIDSLEEAVQKDGPCVWPPRWHRRAVYRTTGVGYW